MKTVIICLMAVLSFACANTQKQQSEHFKKVKYENSVWIVPLDVEQAADSLRLEAFVKNFDKGNLRDTLAEWLSFTISRKDSVSYDDFYGEWENAIPNSLRLRLNAHEAERLNGFNWYYFEAYALLNNKGRILSVYFKVDSRMIDLVKEDELLAIRETIMKKGIDVEKLDFSHHTIVQMQEALRKMKNPDLTDDERWAIAQEAMKQHKPCVYGAIQLCGLRSEDTDPINSSKE